jgi:hypothetical protein
MECNECRRTETDLVRKLSAGSLPRLSRPSNHDLCRRPNLMECIECRKKTDLIRKLPADSQVRLFHFRIGDIRHKLDRLGSTGYRLNIGEIRVGTSHPHSWLRRLNRYS